MQATLRRLWLNVKGSLIRATVCGLCAAGGVRALVGQAIRLMHTNSWVPRSRYKCINLSSAQAVNGGPRWTRTICLRGNLP